jgi:hypothetical protein
MLRRQVLDPAAYADARRVHEDVEPAEALPVLRHQALAGLRVSHICGDRHGPELLGGGLQFFGTS